MSAVWSLQQQLARAPTRTLMPVSAEAEQDGLSRLVSSLREA